MKEAGESSLCCEGSDALFPNDFGEDLLSCYCFKPDSAALKLVKWHFTIDVCCNFYCTTLRYRSICCLCVKVCLRVVRMCLYVCHTPVLCQNG